MEKNNVIGVFLSFYPDYFNDSFSVFKKIVKAVDADALIVIVNNGKSSLPELSSNDECVVVDGDNSAWEFSGWDRGIQYLKAKKCYDDNTRFIFGNDTISKHRKFSWLDRKLFIQGIRSMSLTKPCICGALNTINNDDKKIVIYDLPIYGWICTYLFAINGKYFSICGPFNQSARFEKALKTCGITTGFTFNDSICDTLTKHLNAWLLPSESGRGWYGASKIINGDTSLLINKLKAILNEKFLSAYCVSNGGQLIDVYGGITGKICQRLRGKLKRLKQAIK